jgi:hypothetical protein
MGSDILMIIDNDDENGAVQGRVGLLGRTGFGRPFAGEGKGTNSGSMQGRAEKRSAAEQREKTEAARLPRKGRMAGMGRIAAPLLEGFGVGLPTGLA